MIITGKNVVDLEGEDVSLEIDVLAEERVNAKNNYLILDDCYQKCERSLPYPDVEKYSTAWDYEQRSALQYKKTQNGPVWEEMDKIFPYKSAKTLYVGHVQFQNRNNIFFTEQPNLAT